MLFFSRPFGTLTDSDCQPNLERLGYYQSSLPDEGAQSCWRWVSEGELRRET
jgi:hypothetical protein